MDLVYLEIVIVLALVLANGVFAMSELAIVSARKARLRRMADEGKAGAAVALQLSDNPNRFLSTVQIGITLVGILAGTFGGATLAEQIGARVSRFPPLSPYGEAIGVAVVVLAITYLSLVVGELVPKRLAMNNAEGIAAVVAGPMRALSVAAAPAVWFLGASSDALLALLRVKKQSGPTFTEEEIRYVILEGRQTGALDAFEGEMVEAIFHLGDRRVYEIMTPRPEVVWLDLGDSSQENCRIIAESSHHYFPAAHENLDQVAGVVSVRELWATRERDPVRFEDHIAAPLYVPETVKAFRLLEMFRESGQGFAIVTDEYAGFQGVATLTDLLEAIVGDLPDGRDADTPEAVRRADGTWLLSGRMHVDDVSATIGLSALPEAEKNEYHTLAGFVMRRLGEVPNEGAAFDWDHLRFEVVDMDGRRIDKVLVTGTGGQEDV